jgi:hypothetical protein
LKEAKPLHNFLLTAAGINVGKYKYRRRNQKNSTGYDIFNSLFHPIHLAAMAALFECRELQPSIDPLTNNPCYNVY